jgi:hypothetical protein
MSVIDIALLRGVIGGAGGAPNQTRIRTQDTSVDRDRTNFGYCQDRLQHVCTEGTRGWFGGERPRAADRCYTQSVPATCPPSLLDPPQSPIPGSSP